jgi:hypothetical protein
VVDRTNLEVFGQPVAAAVTLDTQPPGGPYPFEAQIDLPVPNTTQTVIFPLSGTNPNTNRAWSIQPGSVLVIDPNTANEETVTVYNKATPGLFALFRRPHAKGAQVISRGNPGPWPNYNPRKDAGVVPFFAIID